MRSAPAGAGVEPVGRPAVRPALPRVLAVVAPTLLGVGVATGRPLLWIAGLVLAADLHLGGLLGIRPVERLGERLGQVLGLVVVSACWLVLFLPVGLVRRLFATIRGRGYGDTAWSGRSGGRRLSRSGYLDERSLRPPSPRQPARAAVSRALAVIVVLALVVGVAAAIRSRGGSGSPTASRNSSGTPSFPELRLAALRGQPHAAETFRDLDRAWSKVRYRPFVGWYVPDYASRYVNVRAGERRSYEPPAGAAKPLDIVFLGGSTMFGFGLRDEFTVSSAFAKYAQQAGIPVEVHNYGVPGFTNYQEALLLDQLLAQGQRPDLIVFYDGINDVLLNLSKPYFETTPLADPSQAFAPDFAQTLERRREAGFGIDGAVDSDQGASPRTRTPVPPADRQVAALFEVYQRGIDLARTRAGQYGIPTVNLWQPSIFSRNPGDPDEAAVGRLIGWDTPELFDAWRGLWRALEARLPSGVDDLSGAVDSSGEPVYYDGIHPNEAGADLIGKAAFDRVEPQLRQLLAATP